MSTGGQAETASAGSAVFLPSSCDRLLDAGDRQGRETLPRWWWAGVVAAALGIRLLVAFLMTMYGDESHTIAVARHGFADLLAGRAYDVGNPQGYHLLLSGLRQVLGESVLLYRLVSVLAGTAGAALAMKLVAMLIDDRRVALGTGLLMAVNPMQIMNSVQMRPYALQLLLIVAAQCCVLLWRQRRGAWPLVGYAAAMVLAFNVHYLTVLFWAAIGLWWLWDARKSPRDIVRVVGINMLAAVLVAPSVLLMLRQLSISHASRGEGAWFIHAVGWPFYFLAGNCLTRPTYGIWPFVLAGVPFAVVFVPAVVASVRWLWRTQRQRSFILSMVILPIAVLVVINFFQRISSSRYLGFIWVIFASIVIAGVLRLPRWLKGLSVVVLAGLSVAGTVAFVGYFARIELPAVFQTLSDRAGQRFLLLSASSFTRSSAIRFTQRAEIWTFVQEDGEMRASRFPQPPDAFVEYGNAPRLEVLHEALAATEHREVWLVIDPRSQYVAYQVWRAAGKIVMPLLEERYELVEEYRFPPGLSDDQTIRMLKYSRK